MAKLSLERPSHIAKGPEQMKFKSQVFTQVSGSVGGLTYSHNAGGLYTRARTIPVNPSSARQQIMRMYMDSAVTYWTETLTEAERESWRVYASNVPLMDALGSPINVSGQNQFIRSAVPWLLSGKALADIATAPAIFDTGDPGTLALLSYSASTQEATLSIGGAPGWAAQDDGHLIGQLSNPQSPSINFYKGPFRWASSESGDSVTPITSAVFDGGDANPPIVAAVGQRMFVRVRAQYDDGRLTQAFIFDVLAT